MYAVLSTDNALTGTWLQIATKSQFAPKVVTPCAAFTHTTSHQTHTLTHIPCTQELNIASYGNNAVPLRTIWTDIAFSYLYRKTHTPTYVHTYIITYRIDIRIHTYIGCLWESVSVNHFMVGMYTTEILFCTHLQKHMH